MSLKQFGGVISRSDVLRHIKSIGYEFETHDLAKLSLEGDSYLINSGNSNEDMEDEQQFDKNYFTYEIALDLSNDPSTEFRESSESKPTIFTPPTLKSGEIDAEYAEYMLEPLPKDGKKTKVAITNDISNPPFVKMLNSKCRGREQHKNALYMFRTEGGKLYNIKFDREMSIRACGSFTGLEVVITFYKPKIGENIIMETFAEACNRLINHLSGMTEYRGDLFIANKNKKGFTALGKIPYRKLFHKEGTNLYYLETFDGLHTNTRLPLQRAVFKPQMTFCTSIEHVYDVIKHIAYPSTSRKSLKEKRIMNIVYTTYTELMEQCVIPMVEAYNDINKTNGWNCEIDIESEFGKIMVNYLFLIYIKVDAYLLMYDQQTEEELREFNVSIRYFKDVLYMLVRHQNFELYKRMKYHMKNKFKGKSNKEIIQLLSVLMYNVDFLSKYMYSDMPQIFTTKLKKTDPGYGDPKKSLGSYFEFFEKPINEDFNDWFLYSATDGQSTMYPLKGDDMIIETRFFSNAARHNYSNELGKRMPTYGDSFNLKQMIEVVAAVKGVSAKDMEMRLTNKVLNPNTGRMVAKCAEGKVRNDKFRCVNKTKAQATKAGSKTRRSSKK